jgi:hypothetical protein
MNVLYYSSYCFTTCSHLERKEDVKEHFQENDFDEERKNVKHSINKN